MDACSVFSEENRKNGSESSNNGSGSFLFCVDEMYNSSCVSVYTCLVLVVGLVVRDFRRKIHYRSDLEVLTKSREKNPQHFSRDVLSQQSIMKWLFLTSAVRLLPVVHASAARALAAAGAEPPELLETDLTDPTFNTPPPTDPTFNAEILKNVLTSTPQQAEDFTLEQTESTEKINRKLYFGPWTGSAKVNAIQILSHSSTSFEWRIFPTLQSGLDSHDCKWYALNRKWFRASVLYEREVGAGADEFGGLGKWKVKKQ